MSTADQLRIIHSLKRQLGMDDVSYRLALSAYGVDSSKDLSEESARLFILRLKDSAGIAPAGMMGRKRFEDLAGRPGKATPKQLRMIEAMWRDISKVQRRQEREEALEALLKNRLNIIGGLAWLEKRDVQRVIKLLRSMKPEGRLAASKEGGASEAA